MRPVPQDAHPLAHDDYILRATVLNALRRSEPTGTLTDLALARTPTAHRVWQSYLAGRGPTGQADELLLRSLLATADLHLRGAVTRHDVEEPLTQEEQALMDVAQEPYRKGRKAFLVDAYRLDQAEVRAVEAYSDAGKSVEFFDDARTQPNPRYMGAKPALWNPYPDGWHALDSAMRKIPSLGVLGVEMTTYRAPRPPKDRSEEQHLAQEMQDIRLLRVESNIVHGTTVTDMGQRHYLSTAVTYNTHWLRAGAVGGLVAVTGTSGRYINPFGLQGWLDGAEVLYPPTFVSAFEGMAESGLRLALPVAHLREVTWPETGQAIADDLKYTASQRYPALDAAKEELLDKIAELPTDAVHRALVTMGLTDRGLMYLTIDELVALRQRAR